MLLETGATGFFTVKKKRGKKMHIRKKDLFMGLIGLSMMLGSTFSPAQLSELVDELRTMR